MSVFKWSNAENWNILEHGEGKLMNVRLKNKTCYSLFCSIWYLGEWNEMDPVVPRNHDFSFNTLAATTQYNNFKWKAHYYHFLSCCPWHNAHLFGSTLKNQQLLDNDWLVNISQKAFQGLLASSTFLSTELLHLIGLHKE